MPPWSCLTCLFYEGTLAFSAFEVPGAAEWLYQWQEINITGETVMPPILSKPLKEKNYASYHNYRLEYEERADALYKEFNDF